MMRRRKSIIVAVAASTIVVGAAAYLGGGGASGPPDWWADVPKVRQAWVHEHAIDPGYFTQFEARPQHFSWFPATTTQIVRPNALELAQDPNAQVVEIYNAYEGCLTIHATMFQRVEIDDLSIMPVYAIIVSDVSNEIVKGVCLNPSPSVIPLPEPDQLWLLLCGLPLLYSMRWYHG